MTPANLFTILAAATSLTLLAPPASHAQMEQHGHHATPGSKMGAVSFAISCGPAAQQSFGEAVWTLMGLGVAEASARRAVEQAETRLGEGAEVAALIKAGLQELGR